MVAAVKFIEFSKNFLTDPRLLSTHLGQPLPLNDYEEGLKEPC